MTSLNERKSILMIHSKYGQSFGKYLKLILKKQRTTLNGLRQDINEIEQKIQIPEKGLSYDQQYTQLKYAKLGFWLSLIVGVISVIGVAISCWLA